ncbi:MAG: hypothetical protein GY699_25945, partial [Desulfobacteraceae bacterium]|nr:hypothetical protein [Desulfobacteraceae bacterium]
LLKHFCNQVIILKCARTIFTPDKNCQLLQPPDAHLADDFEDVFSEFENEWETLGVQKSNTLPFLPQIAECLNSLKDNKDFFDIALTYNQSIDLRKFNETGVNPTAEDNFRGNCWGLCMVDTIDHLKKRTFDNAINTLSPYSLTSETDMKKKFRHRQNYLQVHERLEFEKHFWRPYGAITLYEAKDLSGLYVMSRRLPKGGVLQLCVGTEIADFRANLVHKRYHAFNLKRKQQGDYVFFDPNKGHIFLGKNANKAA